jgi:microcystin-dependent protein
MSTVTGKTSAAMDAIAEASVTSGSVDGSGHLQLTTNGGSTIDAGDVTGPAGPTGAMGPAGSTGNAPPGAIMMFGAALPPTGWLNCDGSAVSRSTYADLYTAISTVYGAGDGSTTFNLPNFQQRVPRQDSAALGEAGGTTPSSHSHAIDGGTPEASAHFLMFIGGSQNLQMERITTDAWTPNFVADDTNTRTAGSGTVTAGTKLSGNTADEDDALQPFLNVSFIIKT